MWFQLRLERYNHCLPFLLEPKYCYLKHHTVEGSESDDNSLQEEVESFVTSVVEHSQQQKSTWAHTDVHRDKTLYASRLLNIAIMGGQGNNSRDPMLHNLECSCLVDSVCPAQHTVTSHLPEYLWQVVGIRNWWYSLWTDSRLFLLVSRGDEVNKHCISYSDSGTQVDISSTLNPGNITEW